MKPDKHRTKARTPKQTVIQISNWKDKIHARSTMFGHRGSTDCWTSYFISPIKRFVSFSCFHLPRPPWNLKSGLRMPRPWGGSGRGPVRAAFCQSTREPWTNDSAPRWQVQGLIRKAYRQYGPFCVFGCERPHTPLPNKAGRLEYARDDCFHFAGSKSNRSIAKQCAVGTSSQQVQTTRHHLNACGRPRCQPQTPFQDSKVPSRYYFTKYLGLTTETNSNRSKPCESTCIQRHLAVLLVSTFCELTFVLVGYLFELMR